MHPELPYAADGAVLYTVQIGNAVSITKNLFFGRDQTGNIIKYNDLLQNTMIRFTICCTLAKYNNMSKCEVESFFYVFPVQSI